MAVQCDPTRLWGRTRQSGLKRQPSCAGRQQVELLGSIQMNAQSAQLHGIPGVCRQGAPLEEVIELAGGHMSLPGYKLAAPPGRKQLRFPSQQTAHQGDRHRRPQALSCFRIQVHHTRLLEILALATQQSALRTAQRLPPPSVTAGSNTVQSS